MQDFEKLGVFYLGRVYDSTAGRPADELLLYESKDLVTHAVCVGMTGSGKTGLCLSLLEEAAIDGIPALVIDPKGDLGDLLLTFPELRGSDFEPWVNEDDVRKAGLSVAQFAVREAETWKNGLAEWGQDGDRIRRLRDAAEFVIYTPGSAAGVPLSVLKSFAAPPDGAREDGELFRDRVAGTVTSLLGLIGVNADPLQAREHILLSSIVSAAWKDGKDLALADVIALVQDPPMERIGVLDLESFFPSKQRFALAMQLNNLLAAPGFEAWTQGEALDIASLLHTNTGKPRIAIISIAHLSDPERMFAVSLLLNQVVSWVRTQAGTNSLRALVYMDEIFGYFPPVANPPSKQPLLTLLKQARAYGLGVVLATQNPVDLDYKGLANAGTWFIGRLQTERDKARVLDGLEGAATTAGARFDRAAMERTLAGLGKRTFLMNNVHDDAPVVFQVRWAMSYLRGPLTREQIQRLMPEPPSSAATSVAGAGRSSPVIAARGAPRPVLPPDIPQVFVPVRNAQPEGAGLQYQPRLLGAATVHFSDTKLGVAYARARVVLAEFPEGVGAVSWSDAEALEIGVDELEKEPVETALFAAPPAAASRAKGYAAWTKSLVDHLYRTDTLEIACCDELGVYAAPDESERDFRVRLQQAARERRDALAAELRKQYGPKVAQLQERLRKANQAVEREQAQSTQSTWGTIISVGSTALGAFLGRKKLSVATVGKAATAARGFGRSWKDAGDVNRATENAQALQRQLADLETEFQSELDALESKVDPTTIALGSKTIKPKKTNIAPEAVALAWAAYWLRSDQDPAPAWR